MKKILIFILLIAVLTLPLVNATAYYDNHDCPVCGVYGLNTYKTKTEWGKLFYLYKCYNNHYWWER